MIWDRRATSRPVASHTYQQAVEEDELPWGGALRLDKVIETDLDQDSKHSMIRSMRYCRDHRGLLGVLSRSGQLRVLHTKREALSSDAPSESPELLQVKNSHEMDHAYADLSRKNNRIVSFDWVTLGSPVLRPRLLVLRYNGNFEILEQPSAASDHVFKLVSWKSPHRGLEEETPYHEMMQFESQQASEMLAPLLVEQALSNVPIFGPDCEDVEMAIETALTPDASALLTVEETGAFKAPLPASFFTATSISEKLRVLRAYVRKQLEASDELDAVQSKLGNLKVLKDGADDIPLASNGVGSCREVHEALLSTLVETSGLPREAQSVVDHTMLLRAREKYLFDAATNRNVVSDDPWTKFVWDWIAGKCRNILY